MSLTSVTFNQNTPPLSCVDHKHSRQYPECLSRSHIKLYKAILKYIPKCFNKFGCLENLYKLFSMEM